MQHEQIRKFVAGTVADASPIIPISAVKKFNIDVVCEYLVNRIPIPPRDFTSSPRLIVIRSFDVNKPGELVDDLKGASCVVRLFSVFGCLLWWRGGSVGVGWLADS